MDTALSACLGVALAAACGFRVFVPFLVVSVAARAGWIALGPSFAWIGTTPALVVFAVATAFEVLAYYVPWLDNALDSIAGPVAVVSGVLVSAAVLTDVDPLLRWTLAILAGGGAAGLVQTATTALRAVSSATTLGLANPVLATVELASSLLLAVLSLVLPVLALLAVVAFAVLALLLARRLGSPRRA